MPETAVFSIRGSHGTEAQIGDIEAVRTWVASGHIGPATLLRDPADSQWKEAAAIASLRDLFAPRSRQESPPSRPSASFGPPEPLPPQPFLIRIGDLAVAHWQALVAALVVSVPCLLLVLVVNHHLPYTNYSLGPDLSVLALIAAGSCAIAWLLHNRELAGMRWTRAGLLSASFTLGCGLYVLGGVVGLTEPARAEANTAAAVHQMVKGELPKSAEITAAKYGRYAPRLSDVVAADWDRAYTVEDHASEVRRFAAAVHLVGWSPPSTSDFQHRVEAARAARAEFERVMAEKGIGPDLGRDLPVPSGLRVGFAEWVAGSERERARILHKLLSSEEGMIRTSETYMAAVDGGRTYEANQAFYSLEAAQASFELAYRNYIDLLGTDHSAPK